MDDLIATRFIGTIDGWEVTAGMYYDTASKPYDADCYSPEDIEAWRKDKWHYVGIVVTASLDGWEAGDDSIWGMEYGDWADGRFLDPLNDGDAKSFANGYGGDLISTAIANAEKAAKEMTKKLADRVSR